VNTEIQQKTQLKEKRNGDHNDISSKRINSKEVIQTAQTIARTEQ
jgi:hypothetical protein